MGLFDPTLHDSNSLIQSNDGRGSAWPVIFIPRDIANAMLRGNFAVNWIVDTITNVKNRSIQSMQSCDAAGVSP